MNILTTKISRVAQLLLLLCGLWFSYANTGLVNSISPGGSDARSLRIAEKVMRAMGGQTAWDNAHYISWNFFGNRTLLWDKWSGNVRIEWQKKPLQVLVNLNSGKGKVLLNGVEQTQPDTLAKYLKMGKEAWINDSYWLVMPFKLRDPGVTLKYMGEKTDDEGHATDMVQLTFEKVGITPDNKYHVWVDKKTHLVTQWAYFEKFTDEKPRFQRPWTDYESYGKILLSTGRGKDSSLKPVQVLDSVPAGTFEKF